jgi:two-component system, cell cycle sensor histidine kinase and response regulator CckA
MTDPQDQRRPPDGAEPGGKMVILVIDNDAEALRATVRILQGAGFQVLAGGTAAEAIELTHRRRPALVLLSVVLPDGNGVDVAQELKRDPALVGTFVLLVFGTRTNQWEQAEGMTESLADGYITQPLSKVELLAQMQAFLRIRAGQEALRESEERFRRMFQHSAAGVVLVSPDFYFVEVNPAFCRMIGYTESELLGKCFQDVTLPEDRPVGAELTGRVLSGEMEVFHFEKRYLRKDGTVVWGLVSSTLIRDTQRKPLYFVTQIVDITERKRAEEALRKSEGRLREAQKVGRTGFLDWDVRTNEIEWSDETCRMYGFEPGACAPTLESTVGLVPSEDREFVERQLATALVSHSDYDIEHRIVRPDGQVIHVHARGKVTRSADGTPLRMLGTVVDITERKRHEEETELLRLQLAQAQKMESIGRLAGGVAHDFNNLLTVINGYAAFLSKRLAVRDPLRQYALEIGEAGERAASLTSQLLAFSRKQAIMPKAINLNAVIADAERMLQRLIGEDIELVTSPAPRLGLIMADPDQIHQVIINLAVNARDAMPKGGKIEITATDVDLDETAVATHPDATPGRYVQLTITDTGTGMTEEVRQNIFEPFFTTKEQGKGTGLGLAMVYGIVRQNGGWMEVKSEVGRGSTFRMHLPRIDAGAAADEAKPTVANASRGVETVLVVEDQEAVRRLVKRILEAHGYHVLEAASGAEAHAVASGHAGEIDLLLTDVVMPGMDGRTLSEQLRELRPTLRVILMSGFAEDVVARRDALASGLAYIQKPFGPEELAARIRGILDSPV